MSNRLEDRAVTLAEKRYVTVEEVSRKLGTSWAKAHSILSKLTGQGKLVHKRKGIMNLYRTVSSQNRIHLAKRPVLIEPKDLEQLAQEIQQYWTSNKSAQEIVEAERREV